jgi:hypothetical protein
MDRVRFGRVLGKGARMAARTAMEAVEAATAPDPNPQILPPAAAQRNIRRPASQARPIAQPQAQVLASRVAPAARAAAAGITTPFRRASRALWHELTGSFFALFAVSFAAGVWHTRADAFSAIPNDRYRFYAFGAFALLFAYFSISSFLRARNRN